MGRNSGKNYLHFRPGTSLGDVVAIFSVSPVVKGDHAARRARLKITASAEKK
jgi:hypothetical protein